MQFINLKLLVLSQIGIDIAILVVFIFVIRKLRQFGKSSSIDNFVKMIESALNDAGNVAGKFEEQLKEKRNLMNALNERLDKRIISLNVLLNRADTILSSNGNQPEVANGRLVAFNNKQTEIIKLAKKGNRIEEIADKLSIPKEEVKLVLNLKNKFSQLGSKKVVS